MIVINLSNVPPKLRGFLTKYLWEIGTGIYVGNVNARIREAIWKRISDNIESGNATMVFQSDNEQGFDFYTNGSAWKATDFEGLKLIVRPEIKQEVPTRREAHIKQGRYVVLDLETTGLDVEKDRILEIGAIKVENGEILETFNRIIKTYVPSEIAILTGITQEMADGGVEIKLALEELKRFIGDEKTVGFNIRNFDMKIIKMECVRNKTENPLREVVDAYDLVRRQFQGLESYRLKDLAEQFGITTEQTHRAVNDCIICSEIYKHCIKA